MLCIYVCLCNNKQILVFNHLKYDGSMHDLWHLQNTLPYWWASFTASSSITSLVLMMTVSDCFVLCYLVLCMACIFCGSLLYRMCVWPASSLPACSSPSPFMTGCCLFTTTVSWGICKMCLPVCEHRSLHLISQAVMISAVRLKQFSVS